MSRGSALSRSVQFFRESNLDEARVAFQLVEEVMDARMKEAEAGKKSQRAAASTPRKQRRTKAQIAADKAAMVPSAGNEHRQESLASA
jgi:hypothetical protein